MKFTNQSQKREIEAKWKGREGNGVMWYQEFIQSPTNCLQKLKTTITDQLVNYQPINNFNILYYQLIKIHKKVYYLE